jgi:gliding motility-associated-like protein
MTKLNTINKMSTQLYKNFRLFISLFGCVFLNQISYAQLGAFTLQVSATNETCTANATLTFSVTGTTPGSIILYRIYKLPNLTTPIAVTNTNALSGLTSGNYRVEAIQSLGSLSNTQQQDILITNLIVPVVFQTTSQPALYCGMTGTITATASQGVPVAYEIISGPILVPLQPSNIFTGLSPGDYVVRVIDACGDGVVQAHYLPVPPPNLSVAINQNCELLTCTTKSIEALVTANPGTAIGYPIQVQLTIVPQGSQPIVFTQTISSGNATSEAIQYTIPYFNVPVYIASVKVTDFCGNIKISPDTLLQMTPKLELRVQPLNVCVKEINLQVCNLLPPLTVQFLSAPPGFVPNNFNPNGLGPFNTGPITYASTSLNELPEGNYSIMVTDSCGRTAQNNTQVVKGFTDHKVVTRYVGCVLVYEVFIPDAGIPISTVVLTSAPAGYPNTLPQNLSSTISIDGKFSMILPIPGTYVFEGINICGDNYTRTVTTIPPMPILMATGNTVSGCSANLGRIVVSLTGAPPLASVVIVQAPITLTNPTPYDVSSFISSPTSCVITGLPVGNYLLLVTDVCGTVYPLTAATISTTTVSVPPTIEFLIGCALSDGSMRMRSYNLKYVQVKITVAPTGFNYSLPFDVSFNIDPTGIFYMNTLLEGNYVFRTVDICGIEQDVNVNVPGYNIIQNDINLIGNCGSFNLFVSHRVGEPVVHGLWLQKLNPGTGQWGHPLTDVPYPNATIPNTVNSYFLINNATNYNIAAYGTFRVLKYNIYYSNGRSQFESCYNVLKEFVFNGDLNINSATAFPCNSSNYDVIITAGGIAPFTYKITSRNGSPFIVNNGGSNLFAGLTPGIYNFQVQDLCGNIANRLFDITTLSEPTITPSSLCLGQNGELSVDAVSFLNYQWWKGTATGTILSTTNTLSFSPFSNTTSPGTYFVRIYSTSNLSCIDRTISYVVPIITTPKAGLDGLKFICGDNSPIDLFPLLGAPYDIGGSWLETTSNLSGVLSNNIWSPAGIPYGTYTFKYTVNGLCNQQDYALVIIHYNPAPTVPVINTDPIFCSTQNIQLDVDPIPNATFEWTGPNGFNSNEQNPIIENTTTINSGLYSVKAVVNGCESNASITINMLPTPEFEINPTCVNGIFSLSIAPINNSFSTQTASYSWTGPSGFTSTTNPLSLNGFPPGLYQATVTNVEGCPETHEISVSSTVCSIPNVITPNGDSTNENFDLSGLDVQRIEIYSRWGRLVYEQNNYIDQWHGQNMHNTELPDSTYYYILYLRTGEEKQGWVFKTSWP